MNNVHNNIRKSQINMVKVKQIDRSFDHIKKKLIRFIQYVVNFIRYIIYVYLYAATTMITKIIR